MCMIEIRLTLEAHRVFNSPCQRADQSGESQRMSPSCAVKCEQLCQKRGLFLFFSRRYLILKPSLLICRVDNGDETAALSPKEKPSGESGADPSLDKRSFKLRPGPGVHTKKADRKYIVTVLA